MTVAQFALTLIIGFIATILLFGLSVSTVHFLGGTSYPVFFKIGMLVIVVITLSYALGLMIIGTLGGYSGFAQLIQ